MALPEKEHMKKNDADIFLDELTAKVKESQKKYADFTQEEVDKIVFSAAMAVNEARIELAKEAVEETQMGVIEDKVIKNHFAAEFIYNKYRETKTCGEIEYDPIHGLHKIAESVGVIAGIIPVTNPTSTTIFKTLLSLKTRNAIIFSPHPRAKKATIHTAKIMLDAAVKAGAPEHIIGWIEEPTIELTQKLMSHPNISLVLATGGPGMVKAAYSSGTPAIGVGAGNSPAVIDETANVPMAVSSILVSKTFDNGTVCASEQSAIVVDSVYEEFKKELLKQGAYILSKEEAEKIGKIIIVNGKLNAAIVGQLAYKIASLGGVEVPASSKILVAEVNKIGVEEPFSYEKLSPVLALYKASDFHNAVEMAKKIIEFGGIGHTAALYTNPQNIDRINYYGDQLIAGRILINSPSSQGAIGDIYNFRLTPSLTLGAGTYGGNMVSENIGPKHLLNIKTVAERKENMLWFQVPPKIFFKRGCLSEALQELKGYKKAVIVTGSSLYKMGYTDIIRKTLKALDIQFDIFNEVEPDPDLTTVKRGLEVIQKFQPDVIIAVGGGSPIDAAKIMWLLYEQPETEFKDISMRFIDIRKRIVHIAKDKKKAFFVAIPTTSGTGSEVTPFAVITDETENIKYPIADYSLTPDMAIIDPELVMTMPKGLTAASGIDAITHALEAIVATTATDYTTPLAMDALILLFEFLPAAFHEGEKNPIAREKVHYAATLAGMAFANAFLGVAHSMAHKLGSAFHIAHGVANAIIISHVIRFNATEAPWKQGIFSQYRVPEAIQRYGQIADILGLGGKTPQEKVEKLIQALEKIIQELELPLSIKEAGVSENEFLAKLDEMAEQAFDDQCTGTNPRYPLITEIRQLYLDAYYGKK